MGDPSDQSKRARGRWGEDLACRELRRAGYEVVERNWRSPERHVLGELDIVATDGEVVVFCEGRQIARHARSFVPADVVLDPQHARQLRLSRDAQRRLEHRDPDMTSVDLSRYDAAVGVSP